MIYNMQNAIKLPINKRTSYNYSAQFFFCFTIKDPVQSSSRLLDLITLKKILIYSTDLVPFQKKKLCKNNSEYQPVQWIPNAYISASQFT